MNKGFRMSNQNGNILAIEKSINPKQKSYDVLVSDGKSNHWYKVGIIRDIDKLKEVFYND